MCLWGETASSCWDTVICGPFEGAPLCLTPRGNYPCVCDAPLWGCCPAKGPKKIAGVPQECVRVGPPRFGPWGVYAPRVATFFKAGFFAKY